MTKCHVVWHDVNTKGVLFMQKEDEPVSSIQLQSMVDSHEKPFVVIDRDYSIVAVNDAYKKIYSSISKFLSCTNFNRRFNKILQRMQS